MNTKYFKFVGLGALAMLAACTDNDYTELDKGYTELALTASTDEVVLQESNHSSEAIALDWTTGTNYGTGNRISYTLDIARSGSDFANPVTIKSGVQQDYSWAPTVEDLNSMLIDQMGLSAGQTATIDARVTAIVTGSDDTQVATTAFTVTTYQAVTETLYLIGDATPNGWNADNATEMQRTDNGIFTWTGNLTSGEFKFLTTLGQFLPSYNNAGNDHLYYRDSDDQADDKWVVDNPHCYKVDVNLLELTISIVETEGIAPAYDHIYFVGDENGWGFTEMSQDPLDPFLFRIGLFFSIGKEFKFGTTSGSWENMYKATEPNAPYTSTGVEFIQGYDPDYKWYLNSDEIDRYYKICLDIRSGAERMLMNVFTPYTAMYMIGDATSAGWDLANAVEMTVDPSDPNIFTWTGTLNTGELKFSADKQSDWNGAWFMADSEGKAPTGEVEKTVFINKSDNNQMDQYVDIVAGAVDMKWVIQEAGTYTITLNQLLEEVTIAKQ
ncbi:MAG: SusF/SusE family outer membrane protein [Bacteroidales bacterium]|nr:SusF/SusE family outer membrane protein [Bacteroidales bacterium]